MPCFASLMTVAPIIYRYKMQKPNRGNVLKSPGTKPVLAALFLAVNMLSDGNKRPGPSSGKKTFECLVCFADDFNANNLSA